MTKTKRELELERRVIQLEARLAMLEARIASVETRPTFYPAPQRPDVVYGPCRLPNDPSGLTWT